MQALRFFGRDSPEVTSLPLKLHCMSSLLCSAWVDLSVKKHSEPFFSPILLFLMLRIS